MRKSITKRLALFMAILLVLPTVLGMMPAVSVQAATNVKFTNMKSVFTTKAPLQVEVGQKFYVGDYVGNADKADVLTTFPCLTTEGGITVSRFTGTTYASSRPTVASVNKSTGLLTAKATGTTTITMKNNTAKITCVVKVVSKGSIGSSSTYAKFNTYAKKFNSTNMEIKIAAIKEWIMNYYEWNEDFAVKKQITMNGFIRGTHKLAVPYAGRYGYYKVNYDPLTNFGLNQVKVASVEVSVANNCIKIKLKNKLTAEQFKWIQASYYGEAEGNAYRFQYYSAGLNQVVNKRRNWVMANTTVKPNSNVITIKPQIYDDNYDIVNMKIKAGMKFVFEKNANNLSFLNTTKVFTAA